MIKKFLTSIIASLFVISIITTNVSAASLNHGITSTNVDTSNSYITLDNAKLLAQYTISTKSTHDNECPWNNYTKIGQTIPLYDLDNNINAYVFNLINNNKNTGYITVNCNSNNPGVEMFSYCGLFNAEKYTDKINNKKIYHMDALNLLVEKNEFNKEVFYDIKTNSKINADKNTLRSEYKKYIGIKNDNSKRMLNNLIISKLNEEINTNTKANTINSIITTNSQIIYEKHDVPYYNYTHWYTTDETLSFYPGGNNCSPTAGLTIAMYWANHRGKTKLCYNSSVSASYNSIYADMHTNQNGPGTYEWDNYDGFLNYATWCGCSTTDEHMYIDGAPSFSATQYCIALGAPVMFNIFSNPTYGNHSLDVFGTERDSDGNWLRVADGWYSEYDNNYQKWYKYDYLNPHSIEYFTWN